jgi:hypothetical protein
MDFANALVAKCSLTGFTRSLIASARAGFKSPGCNFSDK